MTNNQTTAHIEVPNDGRGPCVILVWAFQRNRPHELVAIATSQDRQKHYEDVGRKMYPGAVISSEIAALDHTYGRGMLNEFNKLQGAGTA